ncbi:hypothetical protein BCR36DRAFT_400882 [Piromyces finnis]|uniref:Periplasmic binding protein-like II n=1 Tax=Piromyces finnis TaxID=1754191 RepID=A0A1Y1USH8_9FUNG|nr:hypothetical protein BCR36DRAFT_400882 [Piromyces finnis]|eukprot:ORX40396.1 hypothetical protein BCR36DRAFT_400882 [Piromyces finnis]
MKCYANEINLQLLIEEPNTGEFFNCTNYSTLQNNFFLKFYNSYSELNRIHLNFTCFSRNNSFSKETYSEFIIKEIKKSNYDILIVDEKFLFNDVSFIESGFANHQYDIRNIRDNYMNLANIYNTTRFSYHTANALENGFLTDKDLFGLPYEQDFNLIYYNKINLVDKSINSLTWDDVLLMVNPSNNKSTNSNPAAYIELNLNDDDELLDFFIEYTTNKYNIKINGTNFETIFYGEKSLDLFNSFQSFITKLSTFSIDKPFEKTQKNIYNSLLDNEVFLTRGKASHYKYIETKNKTFLVSLPPKNTTVTNIKYAIINKNSNYSADLLKNVTLNLISEEMQIFRADNFGAIPTFDVSKKDQIESIGRYCHENSELCELMDNMNRINIKEAFKGKYNPPFIEIRLLLPQAIRNFLAGLSYSYISNIFENINMLVIDHSKRKDTIKISFHISFIITILGSLIPLILLLKYKKHPYLKSYSPLYPIETFSSNNESRLSQYINAPDISLFIKNRKNSQINNKKSKPDKSSVEIINEDATSDTCIENDIIFDNPNNIFFNQSLQRINDQENSTLVK